MIANRKSYFFCEKISFMLNITFVGQGVFVWVPTVAFVTVSIIVLGQGAFCQVPVVAFFIFPNIISGTGACFAVLLAITTVSQDVRPKQILRLLRLDR